jgi:hypothetical protein
MRRLLIIALLLVLPASAMAAGTYAGAGGSIVFTRDHNVWIAAPDGSASRQLTFLGDATHSVSQGTVDTVHNRLVASYNDVIMTFPLTGTGKPLSTVAMPKDFHGAVYSVLGPLALSIDASGDSVAYGYLELSGALGGYATAGCVGIQNPTTLQITNPLRYWCGNWYQPRWWDSKLTVSDSVSLFLADPLSSSTPTGLLPSSLFSGWTPPPTFQAGALAPDGTGLVAEGSVSDGAGGSTAVLIYMRVDLVVGMPVPDVSSACLLPTAAAAGRASFSPDGKAIVWTDTEGVKLVGRPTGVTAGSLTCALPAGATGVLLAPGASAPSWTSASLLGGLGALTIAKAPAIRAAGLRKGLKQRFSCTIRCAGQAQLVIPKALAKKLRIAKGIVASSKIVKLAPGASGTLLLKATASARSKLTKLARRKAALIVVVAGADGSMTQRVGSTLIR